MCKLVECMSLCLKGIDQYLCCESLFINRLPWNRWLIAAWSMKLHSTITSTQITDLMLRQSPQKYSLFSDSLLRSPTCQKENWLFPRVTLHLSGYPLTIKVGKPEAMFLLHTSISVLVCWARERDPEVALFCLRLGTGLACWCHRHTHSWQTINGHSYSLIPRYCRLHKRQGKRIN